MKTLVAMLIAGAVTLAILLGLRAHFPRGYTCSGASTDTSASHCHLP